MISILFYTFNKSLNQNIKMSKMTDAEWDYMAWKYSLDTSTSTKTFHCDDLIGLTLEEAIIKAKAYDKEFFIRVIRQDGKQTAGNSDEKIIMERINVELEDGRVVGKPYFF